MKKPGLAAGLLLATNEKRFGSILRDHRAVEMIVDASAHDVVGEARRERKARQLANRYQTSSKRNRATADGAEVHVEVFEFGGPIAADDALDASAERPPHPC